MTNNTLKSTEETAENLISILQPTHNCWRLAYAKRAAFLIDGADYFKTLQSALEQAQRAIYIMGWDIDGRIALVREHDSPINQPVLLSDLLDALVKRRPHLHIYILIWDFTIIHAQKNQPQPLYKLRWNSHRRVHFMFDDSHPLGACHNQKIVVIDDALAFIGGIDLTRDRWDTPEHSADEPRRINANGMAYPPFHDLELMVDNQAAKSLGDWARIRWQIATGQRLKPAKLTTVDYWPTSITPDFHDVDIAISRTQSAYSDSPPICEIEKLYQDAIAAAQQSIYIENPYLTANSICQALTARLQEPQGPQIVIVLPWENRGWLENATMDVLRARQIKALRQADRFDRLRVFYPDLPGLDDDNSLAVHSKLMIVDEQFVVLGSANLSNRSMSLDTECNVAIEAGSRKDIQHAIGNLRSLLLAEHLDTEPTILSSAMEEQGSLIAAVKCLSGEERSLRELKTNVPLALDNTVPEDALTNVEKPLNPPAMTARMVPEDEPDVSPQQRTQAWLKVALAAGFFLLLAAIWRFTPAGEWLNPDTLSRWANSLKGNAFAPLFAISAFLLGSLTAFPITALIVVSALVFGPLYGFIYALVGCTSGAALTYGVGYQLGRNTVRRLSGSRLNLLSKQLAKRGILAIAVLRLIPVAPFTVINMVAGATHINFRDFLLGTLLGMGPGILGLTVFADGVANAVSNPKPSTLAWVAGVIIVLGLGTFAIRYWLGRDNNSNTPAEESTT